MSCDAEQATAAVVLLTAADAAKREIWTISDKVKKSAAARIDALRCSILALIRISGSLKLCD